MFRLGQRRIGYNHLECVPPGDHEQIVVVDDVGDLQIRQAVLAGAEHLARPTNPQVLFGDFEAVVGLGHDVEPALGHFVVCLGEQKAVGLRLAPPDSAAKLVQLRQAEAVGRLDHHDRRVGHINADLDHDSGDQHIDLTLAKTRHDPLLLGRGHLAVQQSHLKFRKDPLG